MCAGSLEALLDNLQQLERGLWPPKRPRSSFIYFSAASKAAIQEQILEEEQQIRKAQREQEEQEQSGDPKGSDSTGTVDRDKAKATAPLVGGGVSRRKKSRFSELLSLSWRNLSAEERQVYEKLAADDHARFERERDIWARSHQDASRERQQRMWEEAQEAQVTQSRAGKAAVSGAGALPEPQECLVKREPLRASDSQASFVQ
jgi:hypothetical protein